MARVTTATIALLWLALGAACGDPSPTSPTPSSAPGTLRGIVADEAGARLPALVSIVDAAGRRRLTTADSTGEYRFDDIASGDASVRVWNKGYQDVERRVLVAGTTTLNVTLRLLPKGVLSGAVTDIDSGTAIAGATVVILGDRTTEVVDDWGRMTTTDQAGRYAFGDVTLGNANLSATAPGYQERRAGQNLGIRSTLDFALRRNPTPEAFMGQVGWTDPPPCIYSAPGLYACIEHHFTVRRTGSIEVVVTWQGGSDTSLAVQVLHETFGLVKNERGAAGSGRRVAFHQATHWAGAYTLRIVNFDNLRFAADPIPRVTPIPFTLTLTRWD